MAEVTFRKGAKLQRWERNMEARQGALKQIGAMVAAASRKSFREQQFGSKAWEPRSEVNVFGILSDLSQGGNPKKRRFDTRPALRDTGALSRSIAFTVLGQTAVRIGSNLPYAGVHQYGGTTRSETITSEMQRRLWKWLKRKGDSGLKSRLGFLLNKKFTGEQLTQEVPARQFVGITAQMRQDIRETVRVELLVRRHNV